MHHAVDHLTHFNGPLANAALAGCIVADAAEELTEAVLPIFKDRQKPFVLVCWSRAPSISGRQSWSPGTRHRPPDLALSHQGSR
jgi:hypothetical protein